MGKGRRRENSAVFATPGGNGAVRASSDAVGADIIRPRTRRNAPAARKRKNPNRKPLCRDEGFRSRPISFVGPKETVLGFQRKALDAGRKRPGTPVAAAEGRVRRRSAIRCRFAVLPGAPSGRTASHQPRRLSVLRPCPNGRMIAAPTAPTGVLAQNQRGRPLRRAHAPSNAIRSDSHRC